MNTKKPVMKIAFQSCRLLGVTTFGAGLLAVVATLSGCGKSSGPAKNHALLLRTTAGDMVVELWPEAAPRTVGNFLKLATKGFYNGTCFHALRQGFAAQGGDPLTKSPGNEWAWGDGGPGYQLEGERNNRPHQRGVLTMVCDPTTGRIGSQFALCLGEARFLDGKHTPFGRVIKGAEVLDAIGQTPVGFNAAGRLSQPLARLEVTEIRLVERKAVPGLRLAAAKTPELPASAFTRPSSPVGNRMPGNSFGTLRQPTPWFDRPSPMRSGSWDDPRQREIDAAVEENRRLAAGRDAEAAAAVGAGADRAFDYFR